MEEDEVVRRYVDINEDDIHFLHNEEDELYNFDDENCGYENAPPDQHHPHIRFPINQYLIFGIKEVFKYFRDAVMVARNWKNSDLEQSPNS